MSRHAAPGPVVIDVRGWFEQLPATGRAAVVLAGVAVVVLVVLGVAAFVDRDRAAVRLADPSNAGPLERAQARALAGPTSFPPGQRVFHDRFGFGTVQPLAFSHTTAQVPVVFDTDQGLHALTRVRWIPATALLAVTPDDERLLIALHDRGRHRGNPTT